VNKIDVLTWVVSTYKTFSAMYKL